MIFSTLRQAVRAAARKLAGRERQLTPMNYFDLIEAFPQPGCAVCRLLRRDTERYLDHLFYEYTLDRDTQRDFRARRGLCNEHGWQAVQQAGRAVSVAILYAATLDEMLMLIEEFSPPSPARFGWGRRRASHGLADQLDPTARCAACDILDLTERRIIQVLGEHVIEPRFQAAFEASNGLCLPHFQQALRATHLPHHQQRLVAMQTAIWRRLKAELEE